MYDAKACLMRRDYDKEDGLDLFCKGQFLKETWDEGYRVTDIKTDYICDDSGEVEFVIVSGQV